jgi:STE24 endopeptidase
VLPLFFTFTPLHRESLRERLESLASRAGTRIVGVYEWALGTRTRKANAALAGLGHTRRILVSDTMLEQYSDDEIEVVLAHELGHHVHHDIWRAIALESLVVVLGFFASACGDVKMPRACR